VGSLLMDIVSKRDKRLSSRVRGIHSIIKVILSNDNVILVSPIKGIEIDSDDMVSKGIHISQAASIAAKVRGAHVSRDLTEDVDESHFVVVHFLVAGRG